MCKIFFEKSIVEGSTCAAPPAPRPPARVERFEPPAALPLFRMTPACPTVALMEHSRSPKRSYMCSTLPYLRKQKNR